MNDGRKAFLFINFCRHRRYFIDAKFMNNDDLLKLYGDRLMALRLQDNGGKYNQYQLPLDGNIDWLTVMRKISLTGYKGATLIEPMNWEPLALLSVLIEQLELDTVKMMEI